MTPLLVKRHGYDIVAQDHRAIGLGSLISCLRRNHLAMLVRRKHSASLQPTPRAAACAPRRAARPRGMICQNPSVSTRRQARAAGPSRCSISSRLRPPSSRLRPPSSRLRPPSLSQTSRPDSGPDSGHPAPNPQQGCDSKLPGLRIPLRAAPYAPLSGEPRRCVQQISARMDE